MQPFSRAPSPGWTAPFCAPLLQLPCACPALLSSQQQAVNVMQPFSRAPSPGWTPPFCAPLLQRLQWPELRMDE